MDKDPSPKEYLRLVATAWGDLMAGKPQFYYEIAFRAAFYIAVVGFGLAGSVAEKSENKFLWWSLAILCVLTATYLVWKKERAKVVSLQKSKENKVELTFSKSISGCFEFQQAVAPASSVLCVRVLPVCKSSVNNCRGWLAAISELKNGNFEKTNYFDAVDLRWTHNSNAKSMDLHPDKRQTLDVFYLQQGNQQLIPAINLPFPRQPPHLYAGAVFLFEVRLIGDDVADSLIFLSVTITDEWDKPKVVEIKSRSD